MKYLRIRYTHSTFIVIVYSINSYYNKPIIYATQCPKAYI